MQQPELRRTRTKTPSSTTVSACNTITSPRMNLVLPFNAPAFISSRKFKRHSCKGWWWRSQSGPSSQVHVVDFLAVSEVKLVPLERVRQLVGKLRHQLVEVPEIEQWTFEQVQVVDGLAGGQDRAQQPLLLSSDRIVFASLFVGFFSSHRCTSTGEVSLLLLSHVPCVSKPRQNKKQKHGHMEQLWSGRPAKQTNEQGQAAATRGIILRTGRRHQRRRH